jgi:predicted membrane protein
MAAKQREKKNIVTGGMILITLGVLIILGKMNAWSFSQSWPLLSIVIAAGMLIQRANDLAGWIIGCVGLVFLVVENSGVKIYAIATFLLPLLLILVGINILVKYFRKNGDAPDVGSKPDRPETP